MKYSELFDSIQGEGALVGMPSVFFRTSYCNLRCRWCDTPHTSWRPENRDISVEDAFEAIHAFRRRHVVITGGEPLIQAAELTALCELLDVAGLHTTIETNATLFAPVRARHISMSPKLANSSPSKTERPYRWHESKRVQADVIRRFLDGYACQVKFVVDEPADLEEIEELVASVPIPREAVILMPQGRVATEVAERLRWLVDVGKRTGYRLSPRLQVELWGMRRGV